jgi:collagenase-like PrtC family protease
VSPADWIAVQLPCAFSLRCAFSCVRRGASQNPGYRVAKKRYAPGNHEQPEQEPRYPRQEGHSIVVCSCGRVIL